MYGASYFIRKVKEQAEYLNTYIRTNISKNQEILNKLKIPKTDINDKYATIVECVKILKKEKNQTELAKGFYTLTLYNDYSASKSREAYEIFSSIALLDQKNKPMPAGYMPFHGTFIKKIDESIIRQYISSSKLVDDAIDECDRMVEKTNELANKINPEPAFAWFIIMLVMTILINVLLVGSVFYFGIKKMKDTGGPVEETNST
jgi:hypothetical protein